MFTCLGTIIVTMAVAQISFPFFAVFHLAAKPLSPCLVVFLVNNVTFEVEVQDLVHITRL